MFLFYSSGGLVLTRFEWVHWSWLIIHSSWPFSPPSQQPWPWTVSDCQPFTSQQQLTFLASQHDLLCMYYLVLVHVTALHSTQYKHSNPLWAEIWPHVPPASPAFTPKYHNNEGDRFFTSTDFSLWFTGTMEVFCNGFFCKLGRNMMDVCWGGGGCWTTHYWSC